MLPVTVKTAIVAVDQGTSMEKSADVQENYLNGNQFDSFSSSSASLRHVNYRYSSSLFLSENKDLFLVNSFLLLDFR